MEANKKYGWLSMVKFNYCKPSPLLGQYICWR